MRIDPKSCEIYGKFGIKDAPEVLVIWLNVHYSSVKNKLDRFRKSGIPETLTQEEIMAHVITSPQIQAEFDYRWDGAAGQITVKTVKKWRAWMEVQDGRKVIMTQWGNPSELFMPDM